jgi:group I intron endonuclease
MIIYYLKNKINNKYYVGRTTQTLKNRIGAHFIKAKKKRYKIEKAIFKYGINNFEYGILCICNDNFSIFFAERFYIKKYNSLLKGYNCTEGGVGGAFSKESRDKISKSNKGKKAWNKGLTASTDERVKKYSEKRKNKKLSNESKLKMSIASKIRANKPENIIKFKENNPSKNRESVEKGRKTIIENKLLAGKNNPRYKEVDIEKLKKLYYNDVRLIEIQKELGISETTLTKRIKDNNLSRKKRYLNRKLDLNGKNNPRWNNEIDEKQITNLFAKGLSVSKISKILDISQSTLRRRIKILGLKNE